VCLCEHPAQLHLIVAAGNEDGEEQGCELGCLSLLDRLVNLLHEIAVRLKVKGLHGLSVLLLGLQLFSIAVCECLLLSGYGGALTHQSLKDEKCVKQICLLTKTQKHTNKQTNKQCKHRAHTKQKKTQKQTVNTNVAWVRLVHFS
jgi:hypothetical protein